MKISALTAATTPLSGAELFPIVQSGNTRRVSLNDLLRSIGNGTAAAPALAPGGDPNTGIYFPAADTVALATGGAERWRTDANGRVGIGVTSLSAQFQVGSGGAFGVQSQRDGNGNTFTPQMAHVVQSGVAAMTVQVLDGTTNRRVGLFMDTPNNIAGINVNYSSGMPPFVISNGTLELMRLDNSGQANVAFGTNSPFNFGTGVNALTVSGAQNARIVLEDTGWEATGDGVGQIQFNDGGFSLVTSSRSGTGVTNSTTRLTLDAAGNLGLGMTPSPWGAGWTALQIRSGGASIWTDGSDRAFYTINGYFDGTNRIYATNGVATEYEQGGGAHSWKIAASGTAGNVISFNQAMTLDASGNLGIGVTAPNEALSVRRDGGGIFTARVRNASNAIDARAAILFQNDVGDVGFIGAHASTTGAGIGFPDRMVLQSQTASGIHLVASNASGAILFNTGGTASANLRWWISNSGHLLTGTDGAYDIGASSGNRPRNLYLASGANVACPDNFVIYDSTSAITRFGFSTNNTYNTRTAGSHIFQAAGTERVRIKAEGQVRYVPLASAPTTNVEDGDVYYDSGTNKLRVRAGGAWTDLH